MAVNIDNEIALEYRRTRHCLMVPRLAHCLLLLAKSEVTAAVNCPEFARQCVAACNNCATAH
eukprot:14064-Heterococcus_DN1.PRE.5